MKSLSEVVLTTIAVGLCTLAYRAANDYYDEWRSKQKPAT